MRGSIPTFWTQESAISIPKPPIVNSRVDPMYSATQVIYYGLLNNGEGFLSIPIAVRHLRLQRPHTRTTLGLAYLRVLCTFSRCRQHAKLEAYHVCIISPRPRNKLTSYRRAEDFQFAMHSSFLNLLPLKTCKLLFTTHSNFLHIFWTVDSDLDVGL